MRHVTDKIAEFVFADLSETEMAETKRHLSQCLDCRQQVEQFETTRMMLETSPDVEPPRRIMFEFEKPRVAAWMSRWLAPMAASAAVAFAVVHFTPPQQPQVIERIVTQPAAQPSAQPIDYQMIINELRASEQVWLANELKKQDTSHSRELQRVRTELAVLDGYQRASEREILDNSSSIQLLAAKTDARE
jgi:hypothetical protein